MTKSKYGRSDKKEKPFYLRYPMILVIIALLILAIGIVFVLNRNATDDKAGTTPEKITDTSIIPSPFSSSPPHSPVPTPTTGIPSATFFYDKGQEDFTAGRCAQAVLAYTRALEAGYANPGVVYNSRGNAYACLNDYKNALADYDRATELLDNFAHAYHNKALVHSLIGNYEQALTNFQKAVELDPDFGYRAHGGRGSVYYEMGEYETALAEFNTALSYDSSKSGVFFLRGETYMALADIEAAIADYETALTISPDYVDALHALGYAYYKAGQYTESVDTLTEAAERVPQAPAIQFDLGLVYAASGDEASALEAYQQGAGLLAGVEDPEQKEIVLVKAKADVAELTRNMPDASDLIEKINQILADK